MRRLNRVQQIYLAYAVVMVIVLIGLEIRTASAPHFHFHGERFPSPVRDLQPSLDERTPPKGPITLNVGLHSRFARPSVDSSGTYVASDFGWFYGLDGEGKPRWSFYLADQVGGSLVAPSLGEESVTFVTVVGKVYSLLKKNGAFLWVTDLLGHIELEPWNDEQSILIAGTAFLSDRESGFLTMLERSSGQIIWKHYFGDPPLLSPTVSPKSQIIAVVTKGRDLMVYSKDLGRPLWLRRLASLPIGVFAIDDRLIVIGQEASVAFDLKSGRNLWENRAGGSSAIEWRAENKIAIAGAQGELQMLDPATGHLEFRKPLPAKTALKAVVDFEGHPVAQALIDATPALLDLETSKILRRGSDEVGSALVWWKQSALAISRAGQLQRVVWK